MYNPGVQRQKRTDDHSLSNAVVAWAGNREIGPRGHVVTRQRQAQISWRSTIHSSPEEVEDKLVRLWAPGPLRLQEGERCA
jgi:hypothetical protein